MIYRLKPLVYILIFTFISLSSVLYAEKPKKIFCIQSYKENTGCGARIEDGMIGYLKNTGLSDNLEFTHHYLEVMSKNRLKKDLDSEIEKVVLKIISEKPSIVAVFDDVACDKLIPKLLDRDIPVIFGGMNIPPEKYNLKYRFMESRKKPGHNITGVTEEVDFIKALGVLKELLPHGKNLVIISSDGMDFIGDVLENLKHKLLDKKNEQPFNLLATVSVKTFDDFQKAILKYEKDEKTDIIFILTLIALTDSSGNTVSVKEGIKWVVNNQKKPGFSWMNDWIRLGHLCGACVDLYKCGNQLGKIAERILKGEKPGDIPIEKPNHHFIALNKERADKLGLDIPIHLLEGSKVVYEKMEALE